MTSSNLETRKTRQFLYMVTIHKYQKKDFVTHIEILEVVNWLYSRIPFMKTKNLVFEIDHKYLQLHGHCFVRTNEPISFKKHCKHNGFGVYWRPIYDYKGACDYLKKQVKNKYEQDQILLENYFRYNYAFDD